MQSISMSMPSLTKPATTVVLVGLWSPKNEAYTSFITLKSAPSLRKTETFRTFAQPAPSGLEYRLYVLESLGGLLLDPPGDHRVGRRVHPDGP